METVLIIDDSVAYLSDLEALLSTRYKVVTAPTAKRGLELLRTANVSIVLLDLMLPDIPGLEVLKTICQDYGSHIPVIVVTDHPDVSYAVQAMREGAFDFLPKGFNIDVLSEKVLKAIEFRNLKAGLGALQNSFAGHHDVMILASEEMKKVSFEITRLARLDYDVLLIGETGVGKDLVAFELHKRSQRHDKPFVSVPLRSLSETLIESELFGHEKGAFSGADRAKIGKLEAAEGGTLYIPEISSLNEEVQLKLLQFIQYKTVSRVGQDPRKLEKQVNVRVVMATNEDLEALVTKGKIRPDFYHRISGVTLHIPPLRERGEAVEFLAKYFLDKYSSAAGLKSPGFAPEVLEAFRLYRWPGNVRELKNVVKSGVARGSGNVLTIQDFPVLYHRSEQKDICSICLSSRFAEMSDLKSAEAAFRRAYFSEVLRRSGNSIVKAAAAAGMTPQGFRKTLHQLKIQINDNT